MSPRVLARSWLLSLIVAVVLPLATTFRSAVAQDDAAPKYKQLPIKPEWDHKVKDKKIAEVQAFERRARETLVLKVLKNQDGVSLENNTEAFDEYYQKYLFPRWTWVVDADETAKVDDAKPGDANAYNFLANERTKFFKGHLRATKIPKVHEHLVDITFTAMQEIVVGNFHPAARYNAMLVIAELNAVEVKTEGKPEAFEALAKALPVLVAELEKMVTDLDARGEISPVSVAAMLGVLRHVTADTWQTAASGKRMSNDVKKQINTACLKLVNRNAPPNEKIDSSVTWIQRRAIEILGVLGTLETDVQVAKAMDAIVGNDKAPLSLRCAAAEALGQLNKPKESELNPTDTARRLGELAVFGVKQELQRLDDERMRAEEKERYGTARAGAAGGGGGGGGGPGGLGAGGPAGGPGGLGAGGGGAGMGAAGAAGIGAAGGGAPGGGAGFPGSGKGGMQGGGMGGRGAVAKKGAAEKYQLERTKRIFKAVATDVASGLSGPPKSKSDDAAKPKPADPNAAAPATEEPAADSVETKKSRSTGILGMVKDTKRNVGPEAIKNVEALAEKMDDLRDAIDEHTELDALLKKVREMVAALEKINKTLAANGAPAAVDEDDDVKAPKKPIQAAAAKPAPDAAAPAAVADASGAEKPADPPPAAEDAKPAVDGAKPAAAADGAKKGEN